MDVLLISINYRMAKSYCLEFLNSNSQYAIKECFLTHFEKIGFFLWKALYFMFHVFKA